MLKAKESSEKRAEEARQAQYAVEYAVETPVAYEEIGAQEASEAATN
jgi:hypothetical protein